MRIFVVGNSLWAGTGYGKAGASLIRRLQGDGHEVALLPLDIKTGGLVRLNGVSHYPVGKELLGTDVLLNHLEHFRADVVIYINDIWPLPKEYLAQVRGRRRLILWFPLDHEPPSWRVVNAARVADGALVYSAWGVQQLEKAGLTNVAHAPIGIEDIYKPQDKRDARRKWGFPEDAFIALMVAANMEYPSRKAFPENVEAFWRLAREKEDAVLVLHTNTDKNPTGLVEAIDFSDLVHSLQNKYGYGAGTEGRILFTSQYSRSLGVNEEGMVALYNAADVLLSASMAEGFGMPIVEAQACGVPAIVTDCTSMSELVPPGTAMVKPAHSWWCPVGGWWFVPNVDHITELLFQAYERRGEVDREALSGWARERFLWDGLYETVWRGLWG